MFPDSNNALISIINYNLQPSWSACVFGFFFLHCICILGTHIRLLGLDGVELKCSHSAYTYPALQDSLNIKGRSSADFNCHSTNDVSGAVLYQLNSSFKMPTFLYVFFTSVLLLHSGNLRQLLRSMKPSILNGRHSLHKYCMCF